MRLPTLDHLRWRVDVGISTSALARTLKPTVLMQVHGRQCFVDAPGVSRLSCATQMTLSDGSVKTMEMPVEKFHELRYNVAYVIKEMESVEKKSILKIQD